VTPLHLTNPASPDFAPLCCRTLHDMTRFIHEKAFEGMFHFGDAAATDRQNSWRLEAPLPIDIRVFDVGGGVAADAPATGRISARDILSVPMLAFLDGMLDPRISWREPRPVSVKGFLSVLGESMTGPPPDAQQLGRAGALTCQFLDLVRHHREALSMPPRPRQGRARDGGAHPIRGERRRPRGGAGPEHPAEIPKHG